MVRSFGIQPGCTVYCTELCTGSRLTGRFDFSREGTARVDLFSFEEDIRLSLDSPVYLLTEHLEVLSLFGNFRRTGNRVRWDPHREIHLQTIYSNLVLAGPSEWQTEDRIRRVTFSVPQALPVLRCLEAAPNLKLAQPPSKDRDWSVLDLSESGVRVRLWHQADSASDREEPTAVIPRFEIELADPIEVVDYFQPIQLITTFLSFTMGARITPTDITVSRITADEFAEAIDSGRQEEDHRILHLWQTDELNQSDFHLFGSPVLSTSSEDLRCLARCLKSWIGRSERWTDAYLLMAGCLARRRELTSERLLSACKWLENIPDESSGLALNEDLVKVMTNAAIEAARSANYFVDRERINGAMRSVRSESWREKMVRLLDRAWAGHPLPRPKVEFLAHLNAAHKLRGRAAHGRLEHTREEEFLGMLRTIGALEALCLMLMAVDLPLDKPGRERLLAHRVISEYARAR